MSLKMSLVGNLDDLPNQTQSAFNYGLILRPVSGIDILNIGIFSQDYLKRKCDFNWTPEDLM